MAKKENMMVARELRTRPDGELVSMLATKTEELHKARFKHTVGQLRDTHTLSTLRRDIARLHTLLSERKATKEQQA